ERGLVVGDRGRHRRRGDPAGAVARDRGLAAARAQRLGLEERVAELAGPPALGELERRLDPPIRGQRREDARGARVPLDAPDEGRLELRRRGLERERAELAVVERRAPAIELVPRR